MIRGDLMGTEKYDLAVIGGGAAGLVASVAAGAFGAKVVLLEKSDRLGGECSWTGCVPSKAFISYAENVHRFNLMFGRHQKYKKIGVKENQDVFSHIREVTKNTSKASRAGSLLKTYGVRVYHGDVSFLDNHNIKAGRRKIYARKIIICTGSSPLIPEIEGMQEGYLTNRDIWGLDKLPRSIMIVGAGNIGLEMAQSLNRLGTRTHVFDAGDIILPEDDQELVLELLEILKQEKIEFTLNTRINWIKLKNDRCTICVGEDKKRYSSDKVLIAIGRKPNTDGLSLEAAGVNYDRIGITINGRLKTSAPNIWAAGDCNGINQFSHIAEVEAKLAVRNALFPFSSKIDYQGIPWTTFTDPELSHLGFTEEECVEKGLKYKVFRHSFSGDERAIVDGRTEGKVKILATASGKILGAHILGHRSGELINEFVLARKKSARIYDIGLTAHVYPTLGLSLQRATDKWFSGLVSRNWIQRLLRIITRR
jgi:pyruvate/2-oxoglutarate dehydrogenase complex dihydrolipoamide dehydrogenase (E3) component